MLALLLIPGGLVSTPAMASDDPVIWTPVSLKQSDRMRFDLDLTLRARRLLIEDPTLARFDISVRVDDRVADLKGTVPSMEVAMRAENDLRGLMGLANIRNQITIKELVRPATDLSQTGSSESRFNVSSSTLKTEFGSGLRELPAEPSFSWRPVRPTGPFSSAPVPFLAEGLGRPNKPTEPTRASDMSNRENLRIERIDVIRMPADVPRVPDVTLLAPVEALQSPEGQNNQPSRTERLPFLFIGF